MIINIYNNSGSIDQVAATSTYIGIDPEQHMKVPRSAQSILQLMLAALDQDSVQLQHAHVQLLIIALLLFNYCTAKEEKSS